VVGEDPKVVVVGEEEVPKVVAVEEEGVPKVVVGEVVVVHDA